MKYAPNYELIQRVFADNILYAIFKVRFLDGKTKDDLEVNMLKDIIVIADFNGKNYRNRDIDEYTIKMAEKSNFGLSPPRDFLGILNDCQK